jgi:hypothetical protein
MHWKSLCTIGLFVIGACATEPSSPDQGTERLSLAISASGAQVITEAEIVRQAEDTPPTGNWVLYTRTVASLGDFRVGPGTAPEGVGSMEFNTQAAGDKVFLFNFDYVGKPVGDLGVLRYSTYRSAAPGAAVVSLNIQVDKNGGSLQVGDFTTLVFEPYINPAQGAIQNFVWQEWDAVDGGNGRWWATGAGLTTPGECGQSAPCTLTTILAAIPNATIVGALGTNQGSGNPGTVSAFDKLVVQFGTDASTTYDFEPWVTPTTRETCKNAGWQTARRADGTPFTNQGDCVSYMNTGK